MAKHARGALEDKVKKKLYIHIKYHRTKIKFGVN